MSKDYFQVDIPEWSAYIEGYKAGQRGDYVGTGPHTKPSLENAYLAGRRRGVTDRISGNKLHLQKEMFDGHGNNNNK